MRGGGLDPRASLPPTAGPGDRFGNLLAFPAAPTALSASVPSQERRQFKPRHRRITPAMCRRTLLFSRHAHSPYSLLGGRTPPSPTHEQPEPVHLGQDPGSKRFRDRGLYPRATSRPATPDRLLSRLCSRRSTRSCSAGIILGRTSMRSAPGRRCIPRAASSSLYTPGMRALLALPGGRLDSHQPPHSRRTLSERRHGCPARTPGRRAYAERTAPSSTPVAAEELALPRRRFRLGRDHLSGCPASSAYIASPANAGSCPGDTWDIAEAIRGDQHRSGRRCRGRARHLQPAGYRRGPRYSSGTPASSTRRRANRSRPRTCADTSRR